MINLILKNWKLVGLISLSVFCFYFGYVFNDYKRDSELSVAQEAIRIATENEHEREQRVADVVEQKLAELKANERVIERERIRIVEKPIYNVQCIDQEGLDIIKQYALGLSNE